MKVAITSQGKDLNSEIDGRFARARWFILADTETGAFEAVDNSENMNALHGAGPQAAQKLASLGAEALITGHCGPNAFRALQAGGIKVITGASGTVGDALEKFKSGELKTLESPDVMGHWA